MSKFVVRDVRFQVNEDDVVDSVIFVYRSADRERTVEISVEGLETLFIYFTENPPEKPLSEEDQDLVGFCDFLADLPFETLKSVIEMLGD